VWPIPLTETARVELIDAQDWYEAEALGFRPSLPRKTFRRARAKKFCDGLFFLVEPDALWSSPAFIAAALSLANARVIGSVSLDDI
jgi:hypothetical protein